MIRRSFLGAIGGAPYLWIPRTLAFQRPGGPAPEPFQPAEGANQPMGTGQGIHPGRVVWARDTKATTWDGVKGYWWDDEFTDQKAVHEMMSRSILRLTGSKNEKQAWDALFRNFNETRKRGRSGYKPGERIAIKMNCNQDRSPEWGKPGAGRRALNGLPSPQVALALAAQLVERAGVRGEDILIYDVTGFRNVGQPIFTRFRQSADAQLQKVQFLAGTHYDLPGRLSAVPDLDNPIRFAEEGIPAGYLPKQVTEASYMINVALLRAHGMAGVTLLAKNHFGSVHFPNDGGWSPRVLHNHVLRTAPAGSYNALVDLLGHRHLGGKTMLNILDALYTAEHNEGNVFKWASLENQWAASLLVSQDPVALDSVGVDFLRNEPRATQVRGSVDNYLHEAANAARPASGTAYAPSGAALKSLGVHEHWNNAAERKYSRNLGSKEGIELVTAA
jgi:uncharacterized protein (DUF362 family)